MGRNGGSDQDQDAKSQLASEICHLSIPCTHLYPAFIDWYRLLDVDESACVDVIKQRYRKLALQLHPDKNKHPKAEIAFKLVSQGVFSYLMVEECGDQEEVAFSFMGRVKFIMVPTREKPLQENILRAYICLTDEASRDAFETDRRNHICPKCSIKSSEKTPRHGNVAQLAKTYPPLGKARPVYRSISRRVKELKDRLMEEVAIINTCLKAKAAPSTYSLNQPQTLARQDETPIFNPSDYELQGYPHPSNYGKLFHGFHKSSTQKHVSSYPVFEPRSETEAYVHRFSRTSSTHMFNN